ncbi:antibiotic biosynthesis monooxygenase family protein [Dactylosporangium sp. CA-092794]|uniref:antibiotic biosynthesis monooxygenase family protein n=1 Tax=Dactylosporangium sp. CA-092794 TaxID=3239929 RepID=UPI003D8EA203
MIVLVNRVTVGGDVGEFQRVHDEVAAFMRAQPGARRFQLLRAADEPSVFVEVAEWESREHHAAAVSALMQLAAARAMRSLAQFERGLYDVVRTEEAARPAA